MLRALTRRRCLLAALTTLVASVALTGVASATRSPGDAELAGMQDALSADCLLHQQGCTWNGGLISTVDPQYAFGSMTGATSSDDAILFRNDDVSALWDVLVALTPQTTCSTLEDRVPAQVLNDLEVQGLASSVAPVACGKPAATPKSCASVKVGTARDDVSVLGISCSKARAVVTSGLRRAQKPPHWYWINPSLCSSFIVTKKNRKVEHPLVELSKSQPVIFIDDLTTAACVDQPATEGPR